VYGDTVVMKDKYVVLNDQLCDDMGKVMRSRQISIYVKCPDFIYVSDMFLTVGRNIENQLVLKF